MSLLDRAAAGIEPFLRRHPRLLDAARAARDAGGVAHHLAAEAFPFLIRPRPKQLTVAVTAQCNLRCDGCRYGRDFMVGERLSTEVMLGVIEDAAAAGIESLRLYGGEPLLHPEIGRLIKAGFDAGLETYLTSNAVLLERKLDEVLEAGLSWMTMGFYGVGEEYDAYTGRPGSFAALESSLARVRERCGDRFQIQLNYVLTSHSCTLERFERTREFCDRFGLHVYVDLVSYSIPFFRKGEKYELHFGPDDRERVEAVAGRLLEWKQAEPQRFSQSETFLRAVPDLLLEGAEMHLPCDAYQLLWLGANGDVQLCDVAFPLGNVHERPLREILFTDAHARAARDGFKLDCPNCTCKLDSRIRKHAASRLRYRSGPPRVSAAPR